MNNEFERYERQILFSGFGPDSQMKLKNASVLVVGAGGLGCPVLQYLTGAGIGTIGVVDHDIVSITNLHRQILHPESHLNMNKAESAIIQLKKINQQMTFRSYPYLLTEENARSILKEYDFIVICVDNFETRFLINDICVEEKIPFCNGGIVEMHGQVMTYVPGQGPCYRCIFEDVPAEGTVPTSSEVGVVGPVCGIIGSIQGSEVLKYFTGAGELLTGKLLTFDALSMTCRTIRFPKTSPVCRVCNKG